LLLCYNRTLAEWLESSLPEGYDKKIKVTNFHRLCSEYCTDVGIPFKGTAGLDDAFWKDEASDLLYKAINLSDNRFDAIVIDEGQDFFPYWWIPLEIITRDKDAPFYLFYDPAQNLYVKDELSIPNLGPPIILPTNCRNTRRIAETCSHIRGVDIPVRNDAPTGDDMIKHLAETSQKQTQACKKVVGDWLSQGKLKPSQIAIQSPHAKKNSSLVAINDIYNIPLTKNIEKWKAGDGILFSTIRNFKGLEADAVVITDVPQVDSLPHFSQTDFYVACSRAKHLLAVLLTSEGIM